VAGTVAELATWLLAESGELGALVVGSVVHDGHGPAADQRTDHDGGHQMGGPVAGEAAERGAEPTVATGRDEDVVADGRT
jgi:hypothetical protein